MEYLLAYQLLRVIKGELSQIPEDWQMRATQQVLGI
jgi:hypothetical protein